MFRKLLIATCMLSLTAGLAWAGDAAKAGAEMEKTAGMPDMATMVNEMMKCSVCKHMAPHMAELAPVMTMEVAHLNDGVALMHGVKDASKVELFHNTCTLMEKAGGECVSMTDEQAKTSLCPFCQELRGVMKAGGKMSTGRTATGDIMVITSGDPAVRTRIDAIASQCEAMAKSM
jgi:hypothetical protein